MSRKEQEIMRDIKRRWAIQCKKGELFCFLCGKQLKPGDKYNADHWVPRALGGKTDESNLKPACVRCNSLKGCMSPEEFLAHKDEILSKVYKKDKKQKKYKKSDTKKIKIDNRKTQRLKKRKNDVLYTASYNLKQPYDIGTTIYYIKEDLSQKKPKFEIKEGVIIGFTYKNTVEYVLVKDFFINEQGKIDSELLDVIPLTKPQAIATKLEYEKLTKHLFLQLIQQQKELEH